MYVLVDGELIDTKNKVSTRKEALALLKNNEEKYRKSHNILKSLSSFDDVVRLGDISFYSFQEQEKPKVDEVLFYVIDEGFEVLESCVSNQWKVKEKPFYEMKSSILKSVKETADEKMKNLSTQIQEKTIYSKDFFSQYIEASILFHAGAEFFMLACEDGKVSIDATQLEEIYTFFKSAIHNIVQRREENLLEIQDIVDVTSLKNVWETIQITAS